MTNSRNDNSSYIGRFAPSPTGPLHYGSLIAAVASYVQAKHQNGRWLVRIEDIDPPREAPGASDSILKTLDAFKFAWDESPLYQSSRLAIYKDIANSLLNQNYLYACTCSRKQIGKIAEKTALGKRYPGTCRDKNLDTTQWDKNLRLNVSNDEIEIRDNLFDSYLICLQKDIGDFIVYRKDKLPSYTLAVAVDDAFQNITEVVRGWDLLSFTPLQMYLCEILSLPIPEFMHIPIIINSKGKKLSKQTGAPAINTENKSFVLCQALRDLGQAIPAGYEHESLEEIWQWSFKNWNTTNIPRTEKLNYYQT